MINRCCFAAHSKLYDSAIIDYIIDAVRRLVVEYGVSDFWVGNYGSFDA